MSGGFWLYVALPVALAVAGSALVKKITRGTGWHYRDFTLGTELSLAALTGSLLESFDVFKRIQKTTTPLTRDCPEIMAMAWAAGFTAVAFLFFLWVMSLHQDYETDASGKTVEKMTQQQVVFLLGLANIIGLSLLTTFLWLVKGY